MVSPMPPFICVACGTQHAETDVPPAACRICADPRQYVPAAGQRWTTLPELRRTHVNEIRPQGSLSGIGTTPRFGIGQRALLVPYGESNLLWDCVALLDDATADAIEAWGGLAAIAISHPHYYTTMLEWAERFDCPVHVHSADAEWIMRPGRAVSRWAGETLDLGHGLTLIRGGGHFPGGAMLHRAEGAGELLTGDIIQVIPDRSHVAFMWSYPNYVPLPERDVRAIARSLEPFEYDTIHGAFWDFLIESGAQEVVRRSAERYGRALRGEL